MVAKAWQVTSEDWATGFDIKLEGVDENWEIHLSGVRKERGYLFTVEDRKKMHEIRDLLVDIINGQVELSMDFSLEM